MEVCRELFLSIKTACVKKKNSGALVKLCLGRKGEQVTGEVGGR